jgi:hypothetical protein
MLSIIVCSKYASLDKEFTANIAKTTGVVHEIIHVDNSDGKYSIFQAYNKGITESRYPFLCLVHEDVLFCTQNWGERVVAHLSNQDTGIIGIAGSETASRVPFTWSYSGVYRRWIYNYGKGKRVIYDPLTVTEIKKQAVLLDGVFICMRKELTEKIRFDEEMKGFHGYDLDISLQSCDAGYKNYVVFDILIEHLSSGNKNRRYYQNLVQLYRKWEQLLPLHVGVALTQEALVDMETAKLKVLVTKMAKRAFDYNELKDLWLHYLPYTTLAARPEKAISFLLRIKVLRMIYFFGKLYYK